MVVGRWVLLGAVLVSLAGCGSRMEVAAFQADVAAGDYGAALAKVERNGSKTDAANLLDRGLLAAGLGRYEESNRILEEAERKIDDLYTRSISKELSTLLVNDTTRDYRPPPFEHAFVPYYRAWNYLALGPRDEVLVEARRIVEILDLHSGNCDDEPEECADSPFLRYFSGLLFEWGGETNNAYVSYKQALEAAGGAQTAPPGLGRRLVSLGTRLGFRDEVRQFGEEFHLEPGTDPAETPATIALVVESGVVGRIEEESAIIPIFSGDSAHILALTKDQHGRRGRQEWGSQFRTRVHTEYEPSVKYEYILRIALPTFVVPPPTPTAVTLRVEKRSRPGRVAENLTALAADAHENRLPGVLFRAVARGIIKYGAKKAAEKEGGTLAGLAVNLLGAGLEKADTRSWRSLPDNIQVALLEVPPGIHSATVEIPGSGSNSKQIIEFHDLECRPGGLILLRHRAGVSVPPG
jgi:hypothetical protein